MASTPAAWSRACQVKALLDEPELLLQPGRDLLRGQRGEIAGQVGPVPRSSRSSSAPASHSSTTRPGPVGHVGGVGRRRAAGAGVARSGT